MTHRRCIAACVTVGGVLVTKKFFASGRYEVVMKLGETTAREGGPADPTKPKGTVASIWTFGYRFVKVPKDKQQEFVRDTPMYNPHMPKYGGAMNEYWTELDFPEFGKNGDFDKIMYNTFCQNRHQPRFFPVNAADGKYHTFTTEWRTWGASSSDTVESSCVVFSRLTRSRSRCWRRVLSDTPSRRCLLRLVI